MAKKKKSATTNHTTAKVLAIGAGIAALGAAGYFLFGPSGTKNRKHLKGWMIKMKGEVVERLEQLETVTEPAFHAAVDSVAATYATSKGIAKEEVLALAKELKRHWKAIANTGKPKAKKAAPKKAAKKPAKKAAKKR